MNKIFFFALSLIFFLSACDNKTATVDNSAQKHAIKLGTSPGPYSDLFLSAIKPILEKKGYKVESVEFSNLRLADVALNDGSIDLNVDQHTAYYQDFNHSAGANLVAITKIPTVPAGIYAGRKKSLSLVENGDKIGIPQDPSNRARAYLLLQKAGWITLKQDSELAKVTANNIAENKYNLDIVELDSATIPRSLADLDYAVIPGSVVYANKVDIKTTLLQEDIREHLILVATVKSKNKNTDWAQAVVDAYHSNEFKNYLKEHNKDNFWFIPEELR
jgi:D-methionine transport system substrate-binding protein